MNNSSTIITKYWTSLFSRSTFKRWYLWSFISVCFILFIQVINSWRGWSWTLYLVASNIASLVIFISWFHIAVEIKLIIVIWYWGTFIFFQDHLFLSSKLLTSFPVCFGSLCLYRLIKCDLFKQLLLKFVFVSFNTFTYATFCPHNENLFLLILNVINIIMQMSN